MVFLEPSRDQRPRFSPRWGGWGGLKPRPLAPADSQPACECAEVRVARWVSAPSLPPSHMQPDVREVLVRTILLLKGHHESVHVNWWEGSCFYKLAIFPCRVVCGKKDKILGVPSPYFQGSLSKNTQTPRKTAGC